MILKKPYAFLIKYFKVIHLILLAFIIYITYRFDKIVDFFYEYVRNNQIIGNTVARSYIPFTIFIAVFLVIVFSALMWLLMRRKHKPNQFYLLTGAYYFLLLIAIIYAYNTINDLATVTLDQRLSRAYRDIYQIISFPSFYFILISFIRGIGFDVKKFNFSKDLEELEIKSEDNEEFEFVLGNDSYKWKRKIRRFFREMKYYILENKFFMTIIGGSILIIIAIIFLLNVTLINKRYTVGSTMKTSDFTYKLNNAYISDYDLAGNKIKSDKKYLILDFFIKSNGESKAIKGENFYVKKGKNIINFKASLSDSFSDLGVSYKDEKITSSGNNYIFVFEVDKKSRGKYTLKVFDQIKYKNDEANYVFKNYIIKPKKIDYNLNTENQNLNDTLNFDKKVFGNTTLTIKNIKMVTSYDYKYSVCDDNNENCLTKYDIQFPKNSTQNNLLVVEYELNIDKKSQIYKAVGDDKKKFFDKFMKVTFTSNNKTYITDTTAVTNDYLDNIIFSDIPKILKNSNTVNLVISTREDKYIIKIS